MRARCTRTLASWLLPLSAFALAPAAAHLPQLSPAEWKEDIGFLVETLTKRHPNAFHSVSRERFELEARELAARVDRLEPHQIVVELSALTALIGDGHTGIPVLSSTIDFHYHPLGLALYADGVHCQAVRAGAEHLLGARLVAIGATPVDEALLRVRRFQMGDNASSARTLIGATLALGEVLHAAGLSDSPRAATFTFERPDGSLSALRSKAEAQSTARGLVLGFEGNEPEDGVTTVHEAAPKTARWRARSGEPYWFEVLEEGALLFVQITAMDDAGDEPLARFFQRALEAGAGATRLVIDLRLNDGGNHIHAPLIRALLQVPAFSRRGGLFVLIGPGTFSAAMTFATALERQTPAIFVGEPTGGRPNHYGASGSFRLPHSDLRVRHSRTYFQNSGPGDARPWIVPDVHAPLRAAHDRTGTDPALEAAIAWTPE